MERKITNIAVELAADPAMYVHMYFKQHCLLYLFLLGALIKAWFHPLCTFVLFIYAQSIPRRAYY